MLEVLLLSVVIFLSAVLGAFCGCLFYTKVREIKVRNQIMQVVRQACVDMEIHARDVQKRYVLMKGGSD